jgi:hypothetical protein
MNKGNLSHIEWERCMEDIEMHGTRQGSPAKIPIAPPWVVNHLYQDNLLLLWSVSQDYGIDGSISSSPRIFIRENLQKHQDDIFQQANLCPCQESQELEDKKAQFSSQGDGVEQRCWQ